MTICDVTPPPFGHHWSLCDPRIPCCMVRHHGDGQRQLSTTISIHAPMWGATRCFRTWSDCCDISIHAPMWGATAESARQTLHYGNFNPRTCTRCDAFCKSCRFRYTYFNPRTHKYRYDSTFLYCCGLIGSHVVPIAHSVLSGLDNGPHF